MQERERILPRQITRFNYWEFFRPGGLKTIAPLKQHIQHQFNLLRNASPAVWNKEVRPWLHKDLSTIRNRPFYALKYLVEEDKGWEENYKAAQEVKRQLTPRQQNAITLLDRKLWHYRSQWTWDELLKTIADDQESFLKYCERVPDERAVSEAMKKEIYRHYSKQAIKLLGGGGSYVPPARRNKYQGLYSLDESDNTPPPPSPLNVQGRIASPSLIDGVDWLKCKSNDERRAAKKHTLHWFHHALRNMRAYRNRSHPIPWTPDCAKRCRRLQQMLCT